MKHHVNAIIDNDFWQVAKHEKLQEGNFKGESSMSIGSSHWCRSTTNSDRQTSTNNNRRDFQRIDRRHQQSQLHRVMR